jgi:hypothetical protein
MTPITVSRNNKKPSSEARPRLAATRFYEIVPKDSTPRGARDDVNFDEVNLPEPLKQD